MNDGSEVVTIIRIGMETQYYLIKGVVKSILQLIQFMKKMEKTGILKGKEMNNINAFIKKTEGQFQLLNIPTEQPEELEGMRKNFEKLGITYIVLPDLNPNDGMTQIAYYVPHTNKVEAWYQNFCINHLQGGEKDSIQLRNLTEGNTSVVSIPWEHEIGKLREDLDKLKINYAVLPDLNIGDGYVQVMYANADVPNIRAWFELYQKEMLKQGKSIQDSERMTIDEYINMGKLSPGDYEQTASSDIKEQMKEMEKLGGKKSFEAFFPVSGIQMNSVHDGRYLSMKEKPGTVEITINETLVRNISEEHGLFLTRIPGTYNADGKEELDLALELKNVFRTDDGKTYISFLELNKNYQTFKYHPGEETKFTLGPQMLGKELFGEHFEKVTRKLDRAKKETLVKNVVKPTGIPVPKL